MHKAVLSLIIRIFFYEQKGPHFAVQFNIHFYLLTILYAI